jgi:hypothetical protein
MSSRELCALFCPPTSGGRRTKERRFLEARYPGRCPGLLSFAPLGLRSGLATQAEPPPIRGVNPDASGPIPMRNIGTPATGQALCFSFLDWSLLSGRSACHRIYSGTLIHLPYFFRRQASPHKRGTARAPSAAAADHHNQHRQTQRRDFEHMFHFSLPTKKEGMLKSLSRRATTMGVK